MIKIEEVGTKVFNPSVNCGFAKDNEGDLWYFNPDGEAFCFGTAGFWYKDLQNVTINETFGPFTWFKGTITMGND